MDNGVRRNLYSIYFCDNLRFFMPLFIDSLKIV